MSMRMRKHVLHESQVVGLLKSSVSWWLARGRVLGLDVGDGHIFEERYTNQALKVGYWVCCRLVIVSQASTVLEPQEIL